MPKAIRRNRIRRLGFEHDEVNQPELADPVGCRRQNILAVE